MLHSKQWQYSLHRDFQNCNSTRRSPTEFFSSNSTRVPIHIHHTSIQRILHPESNSTCRRQRSSSSTTTTTYRGQRDLHSRKENSMHRRQGDLLEIHLCVLQVLTQAFQTFQSFMTFQPSRQFYKFQYLQGIHPIPAFSD